jgi:endonuclease/exonuclease/phosphatase family metal-dependent hydrolase
MKTKFIRLLSLLVTLVFMSMAFSGCNVGNDASDTAVNDANTNETQPEEKDANANETETEEKDTNTNETETETDNNSPKPQRNLNEYIIVYPAVAVNTVEELSAYELKEVLAKMGYSLSVVRDSSYLTKNKKMLLVGKTAMTADEMPSGNKYSITEAGNGNVQISAGSYYAYRSAIKYIELKGGIATGVSYAKDATVANMKKNDGTLRVMFYNVFAENKWYDANKVSVKGSNAPALSLRQDMQSDLLSSYTPDVVGFQEYKGNTYHAYFTTILTSLGYAEVPVTVSAINGDAANYTPLFYDPENVTVLKSGHMHFECATLSPSKSVTWAVFKETGTDKQFAVFNTHFMYNASSMTDAEADIARGRNAEEITELIKTVTEQYSGIPAIMGGDLNFWDIRNIDKDDALNNSSDNGERQSGLPCAVLKSKGMILASTIEGVQTNFYTKTNKSNYAKSYHGYYTYDPVKRIYDMNSTTIKKGYNLDYIFFANSGLNNIDVKKYFVLEDDLTKRASDHSPVYADFTLK